MKNYLCDGMNCIQMIITDWELLEDALSKDYDIDNTQIFINLIFQKLTEKLKNCGKIKVIKKEKNLKLKLKQ